MPFAETVSTTDVGLVVLTIVNVVGGVITFWITKRFDAKLTAQEADLKGCQERHAEADKALAQALARVDHLSEQNGRQQSMIDVMTSKIIELIGAQHAVKLSPLVSPPSPDDTGEHEPAGG